MASTCAAWDEFGRVQILQHGHNCLWWNPIRTGVYHAILGMDYYALRSAFSPPVGLHVAACEIQFEGRSNIYFGGSARVGQSEAENVNVDQNVYSHNNGPQC